MDLSVLGWLFRGEIAASVEAHGAFIPEARA